MTIFLSIILSLPFLYIDISVVSPGIIRPSLERIEIKSIVPGYIERIYYREGQLTHKDSAIISLRSDDNSEKMELVKLQLLHIEQFIHDLKRLININMLRSPTSQLVFTDVYKEQLSSFQHKSKLHEIAIRKINSEVKTNKYLLEEKIISKKELFDSEIELDKLTAAYKSFSVEQQIKWKEELARLEAEHARLLADQRLLSIYKEGYHLKAPVSGVIQVVNFRYPGSYIQTGETICIISPETSLIAECLVTGKEVAMIKEHQRVLFRVDAFNYNHFGMLTGSVLSIDNDFSIVEKKPVFKVRCSFDKDSIKLKNGFTGQLKKGLTFQASFILTRRSVWQLLFDKLDDWLNPANHQSEI